MNQTRVAICQPYFILGGRLSLVLGIVKCLNALGITPDILALGYAFTPDQIRQKYGHELRMNFRTIARWTPGRWLPQDFQILVFNRLLRKHAGNYDLLINSSNSQINLPTHPVVISYIHFPREYRIREGTAIGGPSNTRSIKSAFFKFSDKLLKRIYRRSKVHSDHSIACNSQYSKECFLSVFPEFHKEIPVIYPPVKFDDYRTVENLQRKGIISLGRFAATKKQLEQIRIAEQLPAVDFHIVGFVTDKDYFERCSDYVNSHGLANVHLHPNLDYHEMVKLLNSSKYFLHTLENEPFGITAVEAIAAGCIPIVHNSGGQKETVPHPELRYNLLQDVPLILRQLEEKNEHQVLDIIAEMQAHARENFDEPVFEKKFTAFLSSILRQ